MGRRISMATYKELLTADRDRYASKSRDQKSRILDEFVTVTGYHRMHALRLPNQDAPEPSQERVGHRIYDEAVVPLPPVGEGLFNFSLAARKLGERLFD